MQKFLTNGNRKERTRGKPLVDRALGSFRCDNGAKGFLSFRTWKWLLISVISCTGAGRRGGKFPCSSTSPFDTPLAHLINIHHPFLDAAKALVDLVVLSPPFTSPLLFAPFTSSMIIAHLETSGLHPRLEIASDLQRFFYYEK